MPNRIDRTFPPAERDLQKLPRWARVAFAVRCARREQPLFLNGWPAAPIETVRSLDNAITFTEVAARTGRVSHALNDAGALATLIYYEATNAAVQVAGRDRAVDIDSAARVADAARAAARAAMRAGSKPLVVGVTTDAVLAANAAIAASAAGNARLETIRAMWFDYELLLDLSNLEEWNDDSPVDPDLCGPLWHSGPPVGWPVPADRADDIGGLSVTIELPDDATDDEVEAKVLEVTRRLNDLHLALGGKGLQLIRPAELQVPSPVKAGVCG